MQDIGAVFFTSVRLGTFDLDLKRNGLWPAIEYAGLTRHSTGA